MPTNYHNEELAAPASRVWDLLIDWGAIADWWLPRDYIARVTMEGKGDGAVRIIENNNGIKVHERLDGADNERRILHLCLSPPLPEGLRYYRATGIVHEIDANRCRLEWMSAFGVDDSEGGQLFAKWLPTAVATMFTGVRGAVET